MTKWVGIALRQEAKPWPGLNTRGGRIDDGTGQLEDGSINQIINEADTLAKRKGLVRGLNERFNGVVCGLFKYTDLCGRESLIIADEEGIFIRTPFRIPVFENSDAYPFDPFDVDGVPNPDLWRNTDDYIVADNTLGLKLATSPFAGLFFPTSRAMRWFKEATNLSYQVRVEYEFDDQDGEQRVSIVIKGNGDLSSGALLHADLIFDRASSVYEARAFHRAASGDETLLLTQQVSGLLTPPGGFFTLRYTRNVSDNLFVTSVDVVPTGGALQTKDGLTLNTIQDLDLGQISAIGEGYRVNFPPTLQIKVVDGGPV